MPEIEAERWADFLKGYPHAHLLQTAEWGQLKSAFGWKPVRLVTQKCGAQLLFRHLPLGLTVAYLPRGPVGIPSLEFWQDVERSCRKRRAVFLKIEPDAWEDPLTEKSNLPGKLHPSRTIQPQRTILVDLRGSEGDLLARMKQKCRYNIRLAQKKDVTVRPWQDVTEFHQMMTVTGARDEFGVHNLAYYRRAYELLVTTGLGELFVAEYAGKPLAALMVCARGRNAWYLYGASTDAERNRMPAYLLQWQAMCWAKSRGAEQYDLWGIPDEDEQVLEAGFETRFDGLWGVYRFKRGFGGKVMRSLEASDRVFQPILYRIYAAVSRQQA